MATGNHGHGKAGADAAYVEERHNAEKRGGACVTDVEALSHRLRYLQLWQLEENAECQ